MVRVVVFGDRSGDRYRSARTLRSLVRAGLAPVDGVGAPLSDLARLLADGDAPVWLVRAGAWLAGTPSVPPPTRTGRPLCAFGGVRPAPGGDGEAGGDEWSSLLARTGGDLGGVLPADVHSLCLEPPLARAVAARLEAASLRGAVAEAVRATRARVVHFAPLDVHHDPWLRVVQVVTSLQQGGAERIAIELAHELPRCGVRTFLVALGAPTRPAFAPPQGTVDLCWERDLDRGGRAGLAEDLVRAGADVVHGHLLESADAARLTAGGVPLVLTIHNVRSGWPAGTADLRPGDAALLVGCAQAVERGLKAGRLPAPTRTVWNGVDVAAFARAPAWAAKRRAWRERLGFGPSDLVLVAVANPRPQKRLHLLPGVLAATREALSRRAAAGAAAGREARLVLAGTASRASAAAQEADAALETEVDRLGVRDHVRRVGSVDDIASLLAAADVLVSTSAFEGLSLAHLEALAAGLPVVTTDVGGTAEIAWRQAPICVLPADAAAGRFAGAILAWAARDADDRPARAAVAPTTLADFDRRRMAEGYARLYPRVVAAHRRRRGNGLLLVTNNFSTGGAQSSARRLLFGLAAEGVRVRAAVIEEQPAYPTPGRRALAAMGIPVLALPPPREIDPAEAVGRLLEWADGDPPAAVLLWNVIPEHKVLLADALLDVALYDVSPGEMYFASLERYFARPRPGLPYRSCADYGARLAGVVVKYGGEVDRAMTLGAPVHVIPNGVPVDDGLAEGGPLRERADGPLIIGTVARIAPHKRLEELLDALRRADGRLPPHVLRIAGGVERGEAAYAEELRARAHDLAVEWIGEVEDARPFLRGLDVFAMVSEPAGCPNASLEAMAAALPVVATDVGGAGDQVEEGVTGRLVPPADAAAFAAALVALARDAQARRALGLAGRRRAVALFDVRRMVADYRRVCLGGG